MLKLAIILAIATLSWASDVDDIVGEVTPIGVIMENEPTYSQCSVYFVRKTEIICNCKNRPTLPMIELASHEVNRTLQLIPFIVTSKDEAAAVLKTKVIKDCECGSNNYEKQPGLIQTVNHNYFITYVWKVGDEDKIDSTLLIRKKVDSRAEYEAVLKAINFDKAKDYKQVCNVFTD